MLNNNKYLKRIKPGGKTTFCNSWLQGSDNNDPTISTWCRKINDTLKKEGFSGLIPQTTSCLHIVPSAFSKALNMYGEESEELGFNMHF